MICSRAKVIARRWMVFGMVVTCAGLMPEGVEAVILTKTSSGDWFSPVSWTPRQVPTMNDDVFVNSDSAIAGSASAVRNVRLDSTLAIGDDGGLASNAFIHIGSTLDTGGTLTVDGSNVVVSVRLDLLIGSAGSGVMDVFNGTVGSRHLNIGGGAFTNEVSLELQRRRQDDPDYEPPDASGRLTISGADAKVFATIVAVGGTRGYGPQYQTHLQADGSLTISNGGSLITQRGNSLSNPSANITQFGTATVEDGGSTWSLDGSLRVLGSLTVRNGGIIKGLASSPDIGVERDNEGNTGTMVVDGAGSGVIGFGNLNVAGAGDGGVLSITRGGRVQVGAMKVTSYGEVTVSGGGSWLQLDGELDVGGNNEAAGHLLVANGGAVTARDLDLSAANGTHDVGPLVEVIGEGSTLITSGKMQIGRNNVGVMRVLEGGMARTTTAFVGQSDRSSSPGRGTVLIDGPGSEWNVTDALTVGTRGKGTLTLSNDATLKTHVVYLGGTERPGQTPVPAGAINIGGAAGSGPQGAGVLDIETDINIDPTGLIVFNHTDEDYRFSTKVESVVYGAGTIEQRAGTTILDVDLDRYTGATHVIGGKLVVNGALGSAVVEVESGAILGGSGTLNNVLAHDGAIIQPGNSPGVLDITGDLTLEAGATLLLEIAGAVPGLSYDVVNVGGDVELQGGAVHLSFLNGFAPTAGQRFDFLNVVGQLVGIADVQVEGLADGWLYDFAFDGARGTFALTSLNDGVSTAPVPLPATLPLLLGALAYLGGRRRTSAVRDDRRLTTSASAASQASFAKVWDNDDDAEYDGL